MKKLSLLVFVAGCGQPFININPGPSTWQDDVTRRLGVIEQSKADSQLVGRALQALDARVQALEAPKPTPTK